MSLLSDEMRANALAIYRREHPELTIVSSNETPTAATQPAWQLPPEPEWPTMDAAAYHGLAGDIVNTIDPHTESDKVAILVQFLVAFGSAVSGNPYFQVEATKHHANLFALLVGKSSKARKGTSMDRVAAFLLPADLAPTKRRPVIGGRSHYGGPRPDRKMGRER